MSADDMEEQLRQILASLEGAGISPEAAEKLPELKKLLQAVENAKAGKQGRPAAADGPSAEVFPESGFVVKTATVGAEQGKKVFINMCGSLKIASPGNWKAGCVPEAVEKAIAAANRGESAGGAEGDAVSAEDIAAAQNALRFPLSMGETRVRPGSHLLWEALPPVALFRAPPGPGGPGPTFGPTEFSSFSPSPPLATRRMSTAPARSALS